MKTRFYTPLILLLGLALLLAACQSQESKTLNLVKSFETAYNSHDFQAVKALLADDAIIRESMWQAQGFSGKDAENYYEYYFALGNKIHLTDCQLAGETTINCTGSLESDCSRAASIEKLPVDFQFQVSGDKITLFDVVKADADLQNQLIAFLVSTDSYVANNPPEKIYQYGVDPMDKNFGAFLSNICLKTAEASK